MRRAQLPVKAIVTILFASLLSTVLRAQSIQVTNFDAGPVITDLSATIKVNERSSLRRRGYIFNDSSCPLQLAQVEFKTVYTYGSATGFNFRREGSAKITEDLSAIEIDHVLFSVFGEHLRTVRSLDVEDFAATNSFKIPIARWDALEGDVSGFLTVVTFVSKVRTRDGKVWRYSEPSVLSELGKVQLRIADLESDRKAGK